MFTPSARAAFHRLAARAHERTARSWRSLSSHADGSESAYEEHYCTYLSDVASDRTDEAWSASFGPDGDRSCGAHGEEQEAASDAAEASRMGQHKDAAEAHRRAANWAKTARA